MAIRKSPGTFAERAIEYNRTLASSGMFNAVEDVSLEADMAVFDVTIEGRCDISAHEQLAKLASTEALAAMGFEVDEIASEPGERMYLDSRETAVRIYACVSRDSEDFIAVAEIRADAEGLGLLPKAKVLHEQMMMVMAKIANL
jgi:hypothetical protein